MGKPTGFKEFERKDRGYAPAKDRVKHYEEFVVSLSDNELTEQGARCMIVVFRFVITVVQLTTSFLTLTIWFTKAITSQRLMFCIAPITFQSSPVVFVQRHAKSHVR